MATVTVRSWKQALYLMQKGWALGFSGGYPAPSAWMQQKGLGRGGPSFNLALNSFHTLISRDLVVRKSHRVGLWTEYKLTPAGKRSKDATAYP
jgi:hypothetical protein